MMEHLGDVLSRLWAQGVAQDQAEEPEPETPPCPICGGSGFICHDVPREHPEFGKVFPCTCKAGEFAQLRRQRLERLSNLGPLTRLTFENLKPYGRNPDPEHQRRFHEAFSAAQRFAEKPAGWLILLGPPGCGKTHLAAAIANACLARTEPALFFVVPDLLNLLRAAYNPSSEVAYDELFDSVRASPLLILDDLGTQSGTPWAMEKLFQILNARYNAVLPTVITTNQSLADLDERMRVRLTDPDLTQICHVQPPQSAALQRLGTSLEFLHRMRFENFEPEGNPQSELGDAGKESLGAAFEAARRFAAEPEGWLVLQGGYGVGKTHLAAAVANARLEQNRAATFVSVPDLLDHLRSTYAPDSRVTYDELFETIRTAPLLILDDLGTQSSTAWAEEKLYQLFNYRYNARLPTVVTTNLSLDDLDPRLSSRLSDPNLSQVREIDASDYRRPGSRPRPARRPPPRDRGGRR